MNTPLQLSNIEEDMMHEVFAVFSKYADKTRKFGIQLVHSHFPMKEGETLYETHDTEKRMLTVTPVAIESFKKAPLATAWQQTERGNIDVCMFCCEETGGVDVG